MKFYRLMRQEDIHGNSGTGCVITAAGIWRGGQIAYMWKGEVGVMHWATSIDQIKTLHEHGTKGTIEEFDTEKYNSLRELDRFLAGEPLKDIEKKMKKKYLKKEEDDEPTTEEK